MPLTSLERLRLKLGEPDALAPLAALGVICGVLAGAFILSFRMLVEQLSEALLGSGNPDDFEQLSRAARFLGPVLGALLLAAIYRRLPPQSLQVGVTHVLERLAYHQGRLPWRNTVLQYLGATICLVSGHSMGREGPGIHLGAAVSSWVGRGLRAPNNAVRVMIACGAAASIAASFNTPIAGVIFAMEVVMMEYSMVGFTPVILAAVVAAWMSRAVYGHAAAFDVPAIGLTSLLELPFLIFVGCVIGALAALFTRATCWVQSRSRDLDVTRRFLMAGALTGIVAVAVPEVMGIGYDTVEASLLGGLTLTTLVAIVACKLLASTACVGLGLPGGLVGPMLVMGSTAGGALGLLGRAAAPELSASPGLYAMLGMGAMMGACLQAPMAALMAVLELTANVNLILPGMVCIVAATLVTRSVFGCESIVIMSLRSRGIDGLHDPVAQALSRAGVSSRMRVDFVTVPRRMGAAEARETCGRARWLVVSEPEGYRALLHAEALLAYLETADNAGEVDLLGVALRRRSVASVSLRATIQEARIAMNGAGVQALLVMRERGHGEELCGILTDIELSG